ncbi:MAG: VWA domain-containing protein [Paludibacteraceae bacterium]|nr:VWA domain-containing protein [Paludibacteraceae bacterium]
MFRFAYPNYLYLLLLIPILIVAFILYNRKKQRDLELFGNKELVKELMPNASVIRPRIKFSLLLVSLSLLIVGIARPQFGTKEQTVKRQGIEVMIALDISNSMMAEDVAPNRLERAKQMMSKIIDERRDDKIGIIVFAGQAYVQLPITTDYVSAKMFLDNITPELINIQGTAIGEAINTSVRAFGQDNGSSRAIVIITDGEDHEDNALEAAKQAKEKGINIYVVGIGKPEGSPIPIPGTMSFRKDKQGNVVITHLNEQMCRDIASAGQGIYVRADNTNTATKTINKELNELATTEIESHIYAEYNEQYQGFIIIALLILIIDFFILNRKNKRLSKINLFKEYNK